MNRFQIIIKYIKNSRILEYEEIINFAFKNNYELISLRDYVNGNFNKNRKLFILRHDVDRKSNGVRLMFEIEKKYGAKASYYFRNSTFQGNFMKEIEQYGSEASLHFETIADFAKVNCINTKEELLKYKYFDRCLKILKADIERFRYLLDLPCITIASHGEEENRKLGIPNNILTEDENVYASLGIKLEAYNQKFIEKVECYISDTVMEINDGYIYNLHPIEALNKDYKNILFLTHPNHWCYSFSKRIKKVLKMLINKPQKKNKNFKRI